MVQLPDERVYERPQLNAWKFVSFRAFEITLKKKSEPAGMPNERFGVFAPPWQAVFGQGASVTLSA
jgi:hypothetical protein